MDSVSEIELAKLPYVAEVPRDGRLIVLGAFYDTGAKEWILIWKVAPGTLGRIAGGEPVTGMYYAIAPARPDRDLMFSLGTLITQHLSFPKVTSRFITVLDRVVRFGAVFEKFRIISDVHRDNVERGLLIASELEYLIILTRSVYDLVQKLSKELATLIRLDKPAQKAVKLLPDSFADMVLDGEKPVAVEALISRYGLPRQLAEFYSAEATAFQKIRRLRNGITHHGRQLPWVYAIEEGLAVRADEEPWSELPIWSAAMIRQDRLAPLRAVFAYLISQCLTVMSNYTEAFRSCVSLPGAVHPNMRLYLTDPFMHYIAALGSIMANPWDGI